MRCVFPSPFSPIASRLVFHFLLPIASRFVFLSLRAASDALRSGPPDRLVALKDLDLQRVLVIGPRARAHVLATLERDSLWLASRNVCDYSLLLGIAAPDAPVAGAPVLAAASQAGPPQVYYMGLIDTLTQYDFRKRSEHVMKVSGAAVAALVVCSCGERSRLCTTPRRYRRWSRPFIACASSSTWPAYCNNEERDCPYLHDSHPRHIKRGGAARQRHVCAYGGEQDVPPNAAMHRASLTLLKGVICAGAGETVPRACAQCSEAHAMADDRTSSEEPYIADLVVHDEHNSLPRQPRKRQRQAPKEEAAELVEQFDPAAAPTAAAPAGPAPPGASRRGGHRGAASDGVPEPVGDAAEQEEVRELLRVWDAMDQPARNKYHRRRMRVIIAHAHTISSSDRVA